MHLLKVVTKKFYVTQLKKLFIFDNILAIVTHNGEITPSNDRTLHMIDGKMV